MQVMVRFGDIHAKTSKGLALILAATMVVSMTGCSHVPSADDIRPEVNNTGRVRTDPNTLVIPFEDVGEDANNPYSDNGVTAPGNSSNSNSGNSSVSGGSTKPGTGNKYKDDSLDVNPEKFSSVPDTFVCGEDYEVYLEEKVFQPISEKIGLLPQENQQNLYFRVMHAGYNYDTESLEATQAGLYDSSKAGTLGYCGGVSMATFVQRWLGQLDVNKGLISKSRDSLLEKINSYKLSPRMTLLEARAKSGLPNAILCMWGNQRIGATTLSDYISKVNSQTVGVIPNMNYTYYTGARSQATITLNKVGVTQTVDYVDNMSVTDINRVFCKYNQFATRKCTKIDEVFTDEQSVLFVYLDGYTKTLVYLACAPGLTLEQTLGSSANDIVSDISKTLKPTQWAEITALYPELNVVPKGTKGVD